MADAPLGLATFGDSAVIATLPGAQAHCAWQDAQDLAAVLWREPPEGVYDIVPTYDSVLVEFDCTLTAHAHVERALQAAAATARVGTPPRGPARHFLVPTVYGGSEGPDLDEVAAILRLDPHRVVELHSAAPLRIRCMTFPIGSPLLDGPELPNTVPRRASPRTTTADGIVMLAGRQAALSPLGAPTGWQIIGRTPRSLVDVDAEDVVPYRAGDWLHFTPIDRDEWNAHVGLPVERVDG